MGKKSRRQRPNRITRPSPTNAMTSRLPATNANPFDVSEMMASLQQKEPLTQWRECANILMNAFSMLDAKTNCWHPMRIMVLVNLYEGVFKLHLNQDHLLKNVSRDFKAGRKPSVNLSENASSGCVGFFESRDKKFLKSIANNADEPILCRAIAKALLSQYYWFHSHNENDRVKSWDDAIVLCESVTPQEAERSITFSDGMTMTVGNFLKDLCFEFQCYFKFYEGAIMQRINRESGELECFGCIAGIRCDGCGKNRSQLGLTTLRVCSRCQITYYCSKECQHRHHKKHKTQCRRKGEFLPGDFVEMKDEELGWQAPTPVRLLRIIPNTKDWIVCGEYTHTFYPGVKESDLRRTCPSSWGGLGRKDMAKMIAAMQRGEDKFAVEADPYERFYAPSPSCKALSVEELEIFRKSVEQTEMSPSDYRLSQGVSKDISDAGPGTLVNMGKGFVIMDNDTASVDPSVTAVVR